MRKSQQNIEVVPVWRPTVERRLLVLALLAMVDQLAREAATAETPTASSREGSS